MEFHGATLTNVKVDKKTKSDWPQLQSIIDAICEWTEERDEELTALWRSGFSARMISDQIGVGSRAEVIHRVHRLRLSGINSPVRTLAIFDRGRHPRGWPTASLQQALAKFKLRISRKSIETWSKNQWLAFFSNRPNKQRMPKQVIDALHERTVDHVSQRSTKADLRHTKPS